MYSVLFVCTGNICRSPTAEAVFRHRLRGRGMDGHFLVDSAGTHGYHIGEAPDSRSIKTAARYGVGMDGLTARKVSKKDFADFNLILAMDKGHYTHLLDKAPKGAGAEIAMLLDFHREYQGADVPDPYYGGASDFEQTYQLIEEGVDGLLEHLIKELGFIIT